MHPTSILPSPVVTFHFRKTAAYTVKLAATTMLSLLSYLLPCGRRRATTAYKLNKNVILLTNLFFMTMVMAAKSNDGYTAMKQ
jgi:hypothetical protein